MILCSAWRQVLMTLIGRQFGLGPAREIDTANGNFLLDAHKSINRDKYANLYAVTPNKKPGRPDAISNAI
jgi:hypothetical protein